MKAHLKKWIAQVAGTFWLLPGFLTTLGVLTAVGMVTLDRRGLFPSWLLDGAWVYNGGPTGARTLLGAVASSTIGVAGTVFSITIAALSLAAGQMGPRLLGNFTRDRGVQVVLGTFIGTFAYALMVLRTVRTGEEGAFTPHVSLTFAIVLALVCVAMLVYFVGHMANRINVDTVVDLVSDDMTDAIARLTSDAPGPALPPDDVWRSAVVLTDSRRGYLLHVDTDRLADWAAEHDIAIRLLVRPGDYVFPGAAFALLTAPADDVAAVLRDSTALGKSRASSADLEFAMRQLVEVAVRALSPGINDPHTAISALDRLGAALCDVAVRHLPSGARLREGRVVLVVPTVDYDGLVDGMFHLVRQSAKGSPAVLIRMLEVMTAAASCEQDPGRQRTLARHAGLVLEDAERDVPNTSDLDDVRQRHAVLTSTLERRDSHA